MLSGDHKEPKRYNLMRILPSILLLSVLTASLAGAAAQEVPYVLPKVIQHSEPIYPPLARQTKIQGEVRVKITTDGESVRDVESESGHPFLREAAENNARTWKFANHTPATFLVTFRYRLLLGNVAVEFLESPAVVEVQACPLEGKIEYAWMGLGTWKAQLKSAHGKSRQVFKLFYSALPSSTWPGGLSGTNDC